MAAVGRHVLRRTLVSQRLRAMVTARRHAIVIPLDAGMAAARADARRALSLLLPCLTLLGLLLCRQASADEPYRILRPEDATPRPAVLLVPGCGGFAPVNGADIYQERADTLREAGYAVVFVDYLTRVGACGRVSHAQVGREILEAASWAASQPGIDPARIAVIGWSFGGGGVLAALAALPNGTPPLTKAVMFYPDCRGAEPWTTSGVSSLMLLAGRDDIARTEWCDPVVKGAPDGRLQVSRYSTAFHGFDVRSLPEWVRYPFGTMGYDAGAADDAWAAVMEFLK